MRGLSLSAIGFCWYTISMRRFTQSAVSGLISSLSHISFSFSICVEKFIHAWFLLWLLLFMLLYEYLYICCWWFLTDWGADSRLSLMNENSNTAGAELMTQAFEPLPWSVGTEGSTLIPISPKDTGRRVTRVLITLMYVVLVYEINMTGKLSLNLNLVVRLKLTPMSFFTGLMKA